MGAITILMQIGSLGIIILTLFIAHTFFDPNRTTKKVAAELLGIKRKRDTRKMLVFVVLLALIVEFVGALLILPKIHETLSLGKAFFSSIFHSISAFTNTGFSLNANSIAPYSNSPTVLLTLSMLMLFGAIGFTTLREAILYFTSFTQKVRYNLSQSSRIIWVTTFLLVTSTFMICLMLEYNHAFAEMDGITSAINALFYVISSMGTGLQTVATNVTRTPTLLMIMVVAYIGGSPGSTGSGIKTTTAAILFAALRSVIRGKDNVVLRGRKIDTAQVNKATAMIALSLPFILLIAFFLLITDANFTLLDTLFETVSAFANMGISTGITAELTVLGKLLICITMLTGRIGMFTLIFAIRRTKNIHGKPIARIDDNMPIL